MSARHLVVPVLLALALASAARARPEVVSPDELIPDDRYDPRAEQPRAPPPAPNRAYAGPPPRRPPRPPPTPDIDAELGADAPPPLAPRPRVVTLPELILGLMEKNFELVAQKHAINAAHRSLQNARAQQLPLASLHSRYQDSNFDNRFRDIGDLFPSSLTDATGRPFVDAAASTFGDIFDAHAFINGITIKVPVYHGDRLAALPRAARVKEDIEIIKRERLVQDLILRLVEVYLDLLFENKRFALKEQELAKKQADLRVIQEREKGKLTLRQQILAVEIEIEDIRQDQLEIDNNRLVLRERIGKLTGLPRSAPVAFKPDAGLKELEMPLEEMVKEAKRANPAIRAQMKAVDLAGEQIALANAKDRVTVDFQLDADDHYIPRDDTHSAGVYNAVLALNWDVFDGGRNYNEQREAREKREQIIAELEVLAQNLDTEVRQTYYKYTESRKSIARADKNIELARENLRVVQARVDEQALLPVDLEEARVNLQKAIVSRERAMTQFTKALAKLYFLLGQLIPTSFAN